MSAVTAESPAVAGSVQERSAAMRELDAGYLARLRAATDGEQIVVVMRRWSLMRNLLLNRERGL